MSVLACSRLFCESIMCDTYIETIGYVCDECRDEFKEEMKEEDNLTRDIILTKLEKFMGSNMHDYEQINITVDEFYKTYI